MTLRAGAQRAHIPLHQKARTERPDGYPARVQVPDEKVGWATPFSHYAPPTYVAPSVLANDVSVNPKGWADEADVNRTRARRALTSYTEARLGKLRQDDQGRPLNPMGRTGLAGRGLLGKWGANFAADPLITRVHPETGALEMLAISRKDNGQWAIPGGMVDEGELLSKTLARELLEETGLTLDLSVGRLVYQGYVDDPRNTDHAWMETTVVHLHLDSQTAATLDPQAGDDAAALRWLELTEQNLQGLYASHGQFVREMLRGFNGGSSFEPAP